MKEFRDYIEEKEADNILEEGFAEFLGNVLGFGTTGLLFTWMASLLFKGGVKVVKDMSETMDKAKSINFRKNSKELKNTPAVKAQMNKIEERKNRYEEDLSDVYKAIKSGDYAAANKAFHELPRVKQDSIEIKKAVIEEIVRAEGPIITASPTPGSKTFQGIRKIIDLPTAKAMAMAFEKNIQKLSSEEE